MKYQPSARNGRLSGPGRGGLVTLFVTVSAALLAGGAARGQSLSVEILSGPNLVVDSNVLSSSTEAPEVATVAGRVCNTGGTTLTGVQAFIGDFGATTPGLYPTRDSSTAPFIAEHPLLANTGLYSLTHVGGAAGTADANRFVGTLAPGECRVQYWHFTYPTTDPAGTVPVWGASNDPNDDLWLEFDVWASSNEAPTTDDTFRVTMRNEISAMANQIFPQSGQWFNTTADVVYPGDTITSNGINYTLGVINKGFDNDGDLEYDYNAWLQPVGNTAFDPSCFRLIKVTGVLTITRSGGQPDLVINFEDQLYFTDLPEDNTGGVGEVRYTFLALNGPCSLDLSPYQEVASGADNEKFNADYGIGVPPLSSFEPEVTLDKSVDASTAQPGGTLTYTLDFENVGTASAGLPEFSVPVVITDSIPAGTSYVAGSAAATLSFAPSSDVTILYSTDNRATWSTVQPPAVSVTDLRWWLEQPLPAGESGQATFQVTVDSAPPPPSPFIENTGEASFGANPPFAEDTTLTLVEGNNEIGDLVWRDDDTDGLIDFGEPGIDGVEVRLYWDRNGDGLLDSGDVLALTQDTAGGGAYAFTLLPDGDFLVEVDRLDSDIPLGFAETTPTVVAVTGLSGGTTFDAADFGFGPTLTLDKNLISGSPALEGEQVVFTIDLRNTRPPSFVPCVYETWAEVEATQSSTQPAQKRFLNFVGQSPPNPTNGLGAGGPDDSFALADFGQGANNVLAGTQYGVGVQAGNITQVEALFRVYIDQSLADDNALGTLFFNGTQVGTALTFTTAQLNALVGFAGADFLTWDVTALRAWDWADFAGDLDLQFGLNKVGPQDPGFLFIDALGFRVTSDANCATTGGTINPLPLVDTYDADLLQFVSAVPPADSLTITGTPPLSTGTLSWTNLGPLAGGETRTVTLTFLALEPPDGGSDGEPDSVTTTNTGSSSGATFLSGAPVNPASDTADVTIDPAGTIGGVVWADNGSGGGVASNGVQDGTEPGIPGVTVQLFTDPNGDGDPSDGVLVDSTTTDAAGNYLFSALPSGNYVAVVDPSTLPGSTFTQTGDPDEAGTCSTCDDQGSGQIVYGDGNPANDDDVLDFGYTIPNTFFGNLWEDNDGDATQEAGENGLAGITIQLLDCGANGICGDGDDGATRTTTTDTNGDYQFSDLPDGNYRVVVDTTTLPAGGTWTQTVDPDATLDDQTAVISVAGGQISGPHDFAYQQTGASTIGDTLYADWNGDGDQDAGEEGIPNVTVSLYEDANGDGIIDPATDSLVATTTTDGSGSYSFPNLPAGDFIVVVDEADPDLPTSYLPTQDPDEPGICVTCDGQASVTVDGVASNNDVDFGYRPSGFSSIGDTVFSDDNANGILEAGEAGIQNVTVTLYEDDNGNGIIDAGDAVVGVAVTDASGNYLFSSLPAGDYLVDVDEADVDLPKDGNGDPFVLSTGNDPTAVTLGASEDRLDVDFGFTTGGIIGNFVWEDENADGNQDPSEPGIPNVTVELWSDPNGDGDPADGALLETTTTDSSGEYFFTGLPAGTYVVVVDTADADLPSSVVTGDPDVPGACAAPATCDGRTGVNLLAGRTYLGADFGFQSPGVIGGSLWSDSDGNGVFDLNEAGLGGVTVELLDSTLTVVGTAITNSDGGYLFTGLAPAQYTVRVDTTTLPAGYTQTFDVDEANPCVTCDSQSTVTLAGTPILDRDFGYQQTGAGLLSLDKSSDAAGTPVVEGQIITYTLTVTNTGAGPATDVAVSDPVPTGTTYVASSASLTTPVDRTYRDELLAISYSGSDGTFDWTTAPWVETDSAGGGASAGNVLVAVDANDGDNSILLQGAGGQILRRAADLSASPTATLTFEYRRNGLENGDDVVLEVSPDGVSWTLVATYAGSGTGSGGVVDPSYVAQSFALETFLTPAPNLPAAAQIRFRTVGLDNNTDQFYVDNVQIDLGRANQTQAANDPPALVQAAEGFSLLPGEVMTVTLQVQVDDPLAPGIAQIRNQAAAQSAEMVEPVFDVVIDRISQGGTLGDRVWLDTDGDGVQDIGEAGIANVDVNLFSVGGDGVPGTGDDVLIATTTTDLDGLYVFVGIDPGTYYVDVVDSTVPAGLAPTAGTTDPSAVRTITGQEIFRDLDFGYGNANAATALVGDFVWVDADGDGVQEPGEPGIGGVVVNLVDLGGTTILTTTTTGDGFYLFAGVVPGDYRVAIDGANFAAGGPLEGYTVTSGPQSEGANTSQPLTVAADDAFLEADFGYDSPALFSLTQRVWFDTDADGLVDSGEAGIEGVTVSLLDASGTVVATTTSGPDGSFTFTGLEDGSYTVQITDVGNELAGLTGTTTDAVNRSKSMLIAGADVIGADFGYNVPGAIGDTVWSDADGDGVQDPGEPGIAGVTVELYEDVDGDGLLTVADGGAVSFTVTDASGTYFFQNLDAGTYFVSIDETALSAAGYSRTTADDQAFAGAQITAVLGSPDASFLDADFGYQNTTLADLSGNVFNDLDRDGLDDGVSEPGIAGVTIDLVDPGLDGLFGTGDDVVVATTTTDGSGNYSFPDVADGTYQVQVTDQSGVLTGFELTSGLDALDVVVAGVDVGGLDFGYVRDADTGLIGDLVWVDADRDGVRDAAEKGISGVRVELFDCGNDDVCGNGDDASLGTATTDANGRYSFTGLMAGFYYVDVDETTLPAGLAATTGTTDPSADIALSEGERFFDADFGYAGTTGSSAIGDRVWYDLDGDGFQDTGEAGIGGVQLEVRDSSGILVGIATTAPDGSWLLTGLAPDTYTVTVDTTTLPAGYNTTPTNQGGATTISVVVTADADALTADFGFNGGTTGSIGDTVFLDLNGNGSPDTGEGLLLVTLSLFDGVGDLVATAVTGPNGNYDFVGLPAGDYQVVVTDTAGVLQGLNLTVGTDPRSVTLAAGQDFDDADFGYEAAPGTGSIGDLVWHDRDGDGALDPGEQGIQGVTIDLYRDTNGNGVIDPGIDNFLRTTTTGINGNYQFLGLPLGDYIVDVTDTSGVLAGFVLTTGTEPQAVTLTSGIPSRSDVDFGYTAPANHAILGTTFEDVDGNGVLDAVAGDIPEGGILLRLYRDLDGDGILDPEDPLIGARLSLFGAGVDGDYSFTNLPDGDYIVVADAVGSILDGYRQTTQLTTRAIQPVTLSGADSLENDFGFNLNATLVVISSFRALAGEQGVVVEWVTDAEVGTLGFWLFRWDETAEDWLPLHQEILPALRGAPQGGTYRFVDGSASLQGPHAYALVEAEHNGRENEYGPFEVQVEVPAEPLSVSGGFSSEKHAVSGRMKTRLSQHREARGRADALRRGNGRGSGGAVKIITSGEGLYSLGLAELAELFGWQSQRMRAAIKNGQLSLQNRDREIAWTQQEDDSGILFWAEEHRTTYSTENVYWLLPDRGVEMDVIPGAAAAPRAMEHGFPETLHFEEDLMPATAAPVDPELGIWFWDFAFPGNRWYGRRVLDLEVPAPSSAAGYGELRLSFQGLADGPGAIDHRVAVSLNGVWLGDATWNGFERHLASFSYDLGLLREGANSLELLALREPGAPLSGLFVDFVELDYERRFESSGGALRFTTSGEPTVTVTGFLEAAVELFDLTDPESPRRFEEIEVRPSADGTYSVSFVPPASPARFLAVPSADVLPATDVAVREKPTLGGTSGAEYVVITSRELVEAAGELADYRRSQGLTARVVDVEEIYDAFNHGISHPGAIRSFLQHAYRSWTPSPRFVVLAGKGSIDYHDVRGLGGNVVPALLELTPFGLFSSDNAYADLVGADGAPEIAIGRVPALTGEELSSYVAKLAAFERENGAGWLDRVVLVADNDDGGGTFTLASRQLAESLPAGLSVEQLEIGELGGATTRQRLLAELSAGVVWVNYMGHGGTNILADERILRSSDAPLLGNGARLPLVTALTCIAGRFELPGFESLAESLVLEPSGGAVGVWAPSGLSLHADAKELNRIFGETALDPAVGTVGEAVLETLQRFAPASRYGFMPAIYILQGDPAAALRVTP